MTPRDPQLLAEISDPGLVTAFASYSVCGPCPGMTSISNDAPDGLFDTIEDAIEAYSLSLIGRSVLTGCREGRISGSHGR